MTAPPAPAGCRILDWDSDFFGRRIARIEPAALSAGVADDTEAWCRAARIDCAYLLVGADDQAAIDAAQAHAFRLTDIRVTLEAAGPPGSPTKPSCVRVRSAVRADLAALVPIARESHRDTRFYADGQFDPAACDGLYAHWIERSVEGWADKVFVAEDDGVAVGYLTMHARAEDAEIGLVGVRPASRGRGIATMMVREAREWSAARGTGRTVVVTQGRNVPGLRLYQTTGFTLSAIQLWYHRWF